MDSYDLAEFIIAFGSATGDLNFDTRCDLKPNGSIDEDDLAQFALHYGEVYP